MKVLIIAKDEVEAATVRDIIEDIIGEDSNGINYDCRKDAFYGQAPKGTKSKRVIYLLPETPEILTSQLARIKDGLEDLDFQVIYAARIK